MNKKLIAILVLALLIVGGVYMYSAGMLNSLFGISEINGVVFKIPEGYSENNTDINGIHDGYVSKRFSNNGSHISIDVYNNTNNSKKLPDKGNVLLLGGAISSDISSANIIDNITWEEKEISGHKGMFGVQHLQNRVPYQFVYLDGDKYVSISVNDQSVLEKLFDNK
ncbi:MAG: hypothetical protein IJP99_09265 [Methanobrevibacter sp.]|nr:hypothetical protein [Methanobrevibacter sp.]